jgi:hypothetical protein
MIGYIASAVLLIAIVAMLVVNDRQTQENNQVAEMQFVIIDKLGNQRQQLIDIIRRCGAELTIDKDGNYDAIIPMTPEEFERFKDELRKRKEERSQ